ncbi:hypothetical protein, partial [Acinetobacter baumannii]|uniref:hypothetical protein n=1 Tax=Acinetobacter baumannii TaxID=470 RepID=UPI001BC88A98
SPYISLISYRRPKYKEEVAQRLAYLTCFLRFNSGNAPISGIIAAKSCACLQAIAAIPSSYKSYCREHNFLFFPDTAC